jgi:CelD/BcsL family acetyltransferase involved in cellulose biosynthesis
MGLLSPITPADEAKLVTEALSGGVEIIERLADEWRDLCAEGPCDQPFFRPEWIAAYLRAFAPGKRLLIFTARSEGRLRAALPLIQGWRLLHGLPVRTLRSPTNAHTCRFDLVHGAGQDAEAATLAIWRLLKQSGGWDMIELNSVPQDGASEDLLSLAYLDGYLTGRWEMSPAPYITLPEQATEPEDALRKINSRFIQSVRRKRRKLQELGEIRFTATTEASHSEIERFYQLERSGWKGRKGTAIACDSATRQFYDEVIRNASEYGYLALYSLECDSRAIAMQLCLTYGGRCYLLKSAYDEAFGDHSPGHLIVREMLSSEAARGLIEYDLLPPQAEWKNRWTKTTRAHASCYIFRSNLTGRALYLWKFGLMRSLRRWIRPPVIGHKSSANKSDR